MRAIVPDYIREAIRSLPPLPAAVQQLLTLVREPEVDFKRIVKVIESDQTLTVRTLRAANSAFYGASRQIQTVRQATVLLGREAIVNLALSISVMNLESSLNGAWAHHAEAFWRHSIATGTAARALAHAQRTCDPGEAFVAGLVHDIGKLVLLMHHGEMYADVLQQAQGEPLHAYEKEHLGIHHAAVGEALCIHWNLPDETTEAVAAHHDPNRQAPGTLAGVVGYANDLVKIARIGGSGNRYVELCPPARQLVRSMDVNTQETLLQALPQKVQDTEEVFRSTSTSEHPSPTGTGAVAVHLTDPATCEIIRLALRFHGYTPTGPDLPALSSGDGAATVVATVADADAPTTSAEPTLSFSSWAEAHMSADGRHLNIVALHDWLRDGLQHVSTAAAA